MNEAVVDPAVIRDLGLEQMTETWARMKQFTERREHDGDRPFERPMTKFERRGLRHGHRIVDWRFEKVSL